MNPRVRRVAITGFLVLTVLMVALPALAQRGRFGRRGFGPIPANVEYDGQFTIVRLSVARLPDAARIVPREDAFPNV